MAQLKKVSTACAVCGSCCEVEACVEDGRLVSIEGAKCAKGVAGAQFEYNPERILYPMKRIGEKGEGKFIRISWEEAYQIIAEELLKIREKYGARIICVDPRHTVTAHDADIHLKLTPGTDSAGASWKHPVRLKVVEKIFAGEKVTKKVGKGEAIRLMTGHPYRKEPML